MKENSAAIHVQAPVDVAAFLLNEKRGEILKIETRHRVTIILIPNKHLETPHYKLERIKHDDPRLEEGHASYDMAEQADTDISYSKRQKEDIKPRQEAVVKGITPDQPAPIVERKPVEPAAVTPAVMAPAEQGFFSRMFGFFRKKPVAPVAMPAPAVEEKQQNRERGERDGRGQRNRGRGRGGREKSEERDVARTEAREEIVAKKVQSGAAAALPAPRQQRPQREGNEAGREGNEARREANESRRERNNSERQHRQREERKEIVAEEPLLNGPGQLAASAASPVPSALTSAEQTVVPAGVTLVDEETTEQGEERRRRRRRGGRNRNRRDRENGEIGEIAVTTSGIENAGAEVAKTEAAQLEIPEVAMSAPVTPVIETVEVPVSVATTTEVAVAVAVAVETITPTAPVEGAAATTEVAAPEVEAPIVAPEVSQEIVSQLEEAAPVSPAATTPVSGEPTPTTAVYVETTVAPAPMQLDGLREVLAAAGLTLAVTDPDKLRVAQEAAARTVPLPRVPRERKRLAPPSTEPLVQVETRR